MNKDSQTKAEVLVKRAIYDLSEAANLLKMEDQSDGFYIMDLTKKTIIGEKPTFLTAKNFAIDYLEGNNESVVVVSKHEFTIKK